MHFEAAKPSLQMTTYRRSYFSTSIVSKDDN